MATQAVEPLAPVRRALLDRAHAEAAALVASARQEATRTLTRAGAEAEAIRAQARAQGEADAATALLSARARARRRARAVVLRAESEAYEELRRRVRRSMSDLRQDPSYPVLLGRLRAQARAALGPDAKVVEAPEGGVVAESGGRHFTCTLAGLADHQLATMPGAEGLWS